MADNYVFTPGSGGTAAADDVGNVLYPRIKMNWGADGAANDVSAANPLPSSIINGSIAVTAGTGVITSGTISVNTPGTITSGTVSVNTPGTITSGSISVIAGTGIITASTVNAATINTGTINSATVNAGTFRNDGRSSRNIITYATTVSLAGSAYGTIIGSASVGAGTSLWVNDISLVNQTGTVTCVAGFGTWNQGTSVLVRGQFGPNAGIQKSYPLAVNAGMTNQDLTVWSNATANIDVSVSYFISA
jgi:hypothetical protein